jgi:hypothetical protein
MGKVRKINENSVCCCKKSSFVTKVTYKEGVLTVRFKGNDHKYEYHYVPESAYKTLISAESIGHELTKSIKGAYPCRKVKVKK